MSTSLDALRQRTAPTPHVSQATAVEQSRAVAEVAAAVEVAKRFPRDLQQARQQMLDSCQLKAVADRAFFRYSRAGSSVTGPSIHLARELARCWTNVQYGITELRRDDEAGVSEMMAWAWDCQTNTRSENKFVVPHARDTKGGRKRLDDLRDIYENNANNGARRVREAIFGVLPPWFTEEAKDVCRRTMEDGGGESLPVRIDKMLAAFRELGVNATQLADKLGQPVDRWTAADVASLRVTYSSLRNGEVTREEEFPAPRVQVADVVAPARQEPAQAPAGPSPAPAAAPAPTPAQAGEPLADRRQVQRLQILLRGALENDREKRLEWVEGTVGRPIESTNELTVLEADRCLKAAEALPTRSRPTSSDEPPAEEGR